MFRLSFLVVAFIIIGSSETLSASNLSEYDVIRVVDNYNSCSRKNEERWKNNFVNCFVNRKNLFKSRRDLFNIVARLLDRSKRCIKYATLECRPDYDGFLNIMGKVIEMIKRYCNMHVELLTKAGFITYAERAEKIIDLNCVENSLTKDSYEKCFSGVLPVYRQFGENQTSDAIYQKEVEMAILCTNTVKRQCSKSVIIDLNKVVRYILGVKQPEKEEIETDVTSTELPRHAESPKNKSEEEKTEKENIDDDSLALNLPNSTNHHEVDEFLEAEKEKQESNFKNSDSLDFRQIKHDDDLDFHYYTRYYDFTEDFTSNKQTTMLHLEKSEKEIIKNDPKIIENAELTEASVLLEDSETEDFPRVFFTFPNTKAEEDAPQFRGTLQFLKTTMFPEALESVKSSTFPNTRKEDNVPHFRGTLKVLKTTEFPKHENLPVTDFEDSKDFELPETGKDIMIDMLNWKSKTTTSTESQKLTEQFKASTYMNVEKKDNDFQFIVRLKDVVTPKLEDRANSFGLDTSKDYIVADAETNTVAEQTTMHYEDEFTSSTTLFKRVEFPKIIESTTPPKSVDISISTTSIKPSTFTENLKTNTYEKSSKSTEHKKFTMPTNSLKTTENPRTTRLIKKQTKPTEYPRTNTPTKPPKSTQHGRTASTKLPKHIENPRTTMLTKPPKLIENSRTSTSTKSPKSTERQRTSKSTKTTEHRRTTTSTKPPKRTVRPRTTTTTMSSVSFSAVRSRGDDHERSRDHDHERSRDDDRKRSREDTFRPRPTEAPRPWYDFIVRPFVSLWRTIKSWFGW